MKAHQNLFQIKPLIAALVFAILPMGISGCEDPLYPNFFMPNFNTVPNPNPGGNGSDNRECFHAEFNQPEAEVNHIMDILFVVDTSVSLNSERMRIADNLVALVEAMPLVADYQVGVMLAHGSLSPFVGTLYQADAEPLVLKSTELTTGEISSHLRSKFFNPPFDRSADGGEEGLFSLLQSLSAEGVAAMRKSGFYRDNAALAVVFISDENDICAVYPEDVVRVPDIDELEGPAFDRDCAGVTPMAVVDQLRSLQSDLPLLVGGIVNNNLATVPNGDENEYGYGYMETIEHANGISVDLQSADFQQGLTDIGNLATVKLTLITEVTLGPSVDPETIEVLVDGEMVEWNLIPEKNELHLTDYAGEANSLVEIDYCEL